MSADYIVAQETSLVGSIGVLFQYPNLSELLKTIGVKVEEMKSSPLKAAPNGYEPTSPEARAAIEALVKDTYAWFRGMVSDRRKMDDAMLDHVTDGRVFTGRQGVALELVDQLGNEKTAIAWLAKEKGLKADTPVRDWQLKPRFSDLSMLHLAAAVILDAVGLSSLAQRIEGSVLAVEKLNLDGLLALWHPPVRKLKAAAGVRGTAMIKSELVQRIAGQNPHLYQRDIENIVTPCSAKLRPRWRAAIAWSCAASARSR